MRRRVSLCMMALVLGCVSISPGAGRAQDEFQMNFRNARIDDILRILADRYEASVAVTGEVSQTVTVNLTGLDLRASLDALLRDTGYTWRDEGSVLRVLPSDTVVNEVFALKFMAAEELAQVVEKQFEGVAVSPEPHSNSLLVSGPITKIREMGLLIARVDTYRAQVRIQAEMVEVTLDNDDSRGVDLSVVLSGSDVQGEFDTDFSTGNEPSTLSLRTLQGDFDVSGLISLINENRSAMLLSSPEITTMDNQPAKIHVGERVPYQRSQTETVTGATLAEVEFMDVGVQLLVTPTISDDGMLYLQIHSEVSQVLDQSVQNVPRIGTREADTRVMVRDGHTVVIGGLMRDNVTEVEKKVPLLGHIPILGWLFKSKTTLKSKTELLIFITPTVISDPSQMQPTPAQQASRDRFQTDASKDDDTSARVDR